MSTSFPQDVLRRIRALEQGLGGTPSNIIEFITNIIEGNTPVGDSFVAESISAVAEIDYTTAKVHAVTLTASVTSLTLSGTTSGFACGLTLYLIQDGTGSRTVTWPGSVKWPSGTAPTLSTAASSVDIVVLESTDGGTTWYGNLAGKGYA